MSFRVLGIAVACALPILGGISSLRAFVAPTARSQTPGATDEWNQRLAPSLAGGAVSRPENVSARSTRARTKTPSRHYSGPPPLTSLQILDLAASAAGSKYVMGGESWDARNVGYGGTDCSGLIAKAWQLPRASESWEELPDRPTTAIFSHGRGPWYAIPFEQRRPGDAFVRHDKLVKHGFLFHSDDDQFAENRSVWVLEAAAPQVRRRLYSLDGLAEYRLLRRSDLDEVGLVGRSRNWLFGDFVDTFIAQGGEVAVGRPFDRGHGVLVHRVNLASGGVVQDFQHGDLGSAMILRSDRLARAALVSGALLSHYRSLRGPQGELGWPIENERVGAGPCGNTPSQLFEGGRLVQLCGGEITVVPWADH